MSEHQHKRFSIRFPSDDNTLALIDFNPSQNEFNPTAVGLSIDEAYKGSGIAMLSKNAPVKGSEVRIQIGNLAPLKAKVAWFKELDEHVCRIGFEFEE